jgi:hypothetical protein
MMEENEKSARSLNQKEDDSLSKTNINNFYLVLDNSIYSVNVTKNKNNEKIFISAKSSEDNNIVNNLCFYENCFSLEELIIKSKPFKLCDTIDDAFNIFIDLIKAQKVFLKKTEYAEEYNPNSILIFVIKVSLPGGQEQEVEFELKPKKMDKDQYINELIKIIEKLHKENEELKRENAIKDNEINLLKRKYCINNNNKYENNKYSYNKNQSYDSKRNVSSSKVLNVTTINPNLLNTEYNSLYKYGFNDIHNSTDIHSVINYNTIYNSNNKLMNKNNPNSITCKTLNNMSKTFQSTISSFKRGRLTKTSNDSSDFYENKNTIMSKNNNNKDKDNNLMRTNGFNNKSKKKKEIELSNLIYIKNDFNKVTMIPIEDYMSIKQIKTNYCAKKSIPIKGKELYYKGKKLDDEKNLEFYKIPWESTLYVFNVPEKINVFVRCLSGKEFKIIADELDTILKIKTKIYEFEKIPIDKQIVLIDKKILDDEKTLSEFNKKGNVHLIVRRKED